MLKVRGNHDYARFSKRIKADQSGRRDFLKLSVVSLSAATLSARTLFDSSPASASPMPPELLRCGQLIEVNNRLAYLESSQQSAGSISFYDVNLATSSSYEIPPGHYSSSSSELLRIGDDSPWALKVIAGVQVLTLPTILDQSPSRVQVIRSGPGAFGAIAYDEPEGTIRLFLIHDGDNEWSEAWIDDRIANAYLVGPRNATELPTLFGEIGRPGILVGAPVSEGGTMAPVRITPDLLPAESLFGVTNAVGDIVAAFQTSEREWAMRSVVGSAKPSLVPITGGHGGVCPGFG